MHYMVLGRTMPDGSQYVNDNDHWEWLQADAAKAARFLGYIPFDQINDQRNAEPVIRIREHDEVHAYLTTELDISIPDASELRPQLDVEGFEGTQPYRLALVGEKSRLADILGPLAERYDADLFLPTGEISDTQIYLMARAAEEDGRPLAVFYFADCDPAGWQMGISVSRKLQALKVMLPEMPDFEIHRVALLPAQVREYGLPSTPLKASEKRADPWRAATGIEQTEIDALASLRPELLRQVAEDAVAPFYDRSLDRRVFEARGRWLDLAQEAVEAATDAEQLEAIRQQAAIQLAEMRRQIRELNAALRIDPGDIEFPAYEIPRAVLTGEPPERLIDSRLPFAQQNERLIASKAYDRGEALVRQPHRTIRRAVPGTQPTEEHVMTETDIEMAELGAEPFTQAERDAISAYSERIISVPDCFDMVLENGLGATGGRVHACRDGGRDQFLVPDARRVAATPSPRWPRIWPNRPGTSTAGTEGWHGLRP